MNNVTPFLYTCLGSFRSVGPFVCFSSDGSPEVFVRLCSIHMSLIKFHMYDLYTKITHTHNTICPQGFITPFSGKN